MRKHSKFFSCFAKIAISFGQWLLNHWVFTPIAVTHRRRPYYLYAVKTLGALHKQLITLYTKEHTKSMKPHCILGSCSAQFLSIMGCERKVNGRERRNANEKNKISTKTHNSEENWLDSYDWLLVQNTSLQVSLFPEFCRHHQGHLWRRRIISFPQWFQD